MIYHHVLVIEMVEQLAREQTRKAPGKHESAARSDIPARFGSGAAEIERD
jgi:hypothetical protein